MNFFEHQDRSRRKTTLLVFLFLLALGGITVTLYLVAACIKFYHSAEIDRETATFQWIDPQLFLYVCGITLVVVLTGSLYKIVVLARGGQAVAEALGGRRVNPGTTDGDEKRLVNVVTEMAIASGIPVPVIYLLEKESGINAFAAGFKPEDAVVAVTAGCLKQLSRDQLQGVVAHEFSHILNGDMRLNIRLIAMISGIMVIASIGRVILRSGSRSRKNGAPVLLAGLALLVVGYIGVLISQMIQCAISRQREYLADASAVQFTRNPSGIAGALRKIGGLGGKSRIEAPLAHEASHMFFGEAVSSFFASHPPLVERIRRIESNFSGEMAAPVPGAYQSGAAIGFAPALNRVALDADEALNQVGNVDNVQIDYGAELLGAIPECIRAELNDPLGASAVLYALLLDTKEDVRDRRYAEFTAASPGYISDQLRNVHGAIEHLNPHLRLVLLDMAMPQLRNMSPRQAEQFRNLTTILIESDGRINLFEYMLNLIITHRLSAAFFPRLQKTLHKNIDSLMDDVIALVSILSKAGHIGKDGIRQAFDAAMKCIPRTKTSPEIKPAENVSLKQVGEALSKLVLASPGVRKTVFEACSHCVLLDGTVTISEAELLRAVAYSLDLPMPRYLMRAA